MTDINFDELDRAVNSLMNKRQESINQRRGAPKSNSDASSALDSSSSSRPTPSQGRPQSASPDRSSGLGQDRGADSAPSATPVRSSVAPDSEQRRQVVPSRRSGRFMDVVHPSSDMRTAGKAAPKVSREGNTIQPAGGSVMSRSQSGPAPARSSGMSRPPQASVEPVAEIQAPSLDTQASDQSGGFLPEDGFGIQDSGLDNKNHNPMTGTSHQVASPAPRSAELSAEPMTSPFVEGAVVEKRPLGSSPDQPKGSFGLQNFEPEEEKDSHGGDFEMLNQSIDEVVKSEINTLEDEQNSAPVDSFGSFTDDQSQDESSEPTRVPRVKTDLNLELPSEPIEMDDSSPKFGGGHLAEEIAIDKDLMDIPEVDQESAISGLDQSDHGELIETDLPSGPTSAPAAAAGAGQISQQYKTGEDDSPQPAPIFEAASIEPEELEHKDEKKSSWLTLVWVLIFLVLGAGGGAAVYFLLLQ